jgi:hypothetical protein
MALLVVLAACGGDGGTSDSEDTSSGGGSTEQSDQGSNGEDSGGGAGGGDVVELQPPGQAYVSVDGQEWNFETVGPAGCMVGADEFTFSFLIGDNEVGLAGGGSPDGSSFNFNLSILDSGGQTIYLADQLRGDSGNIAVNGNSVSYSGSMQLLPPGSDSEAEPVGDGIISATCE